MENSEIWKPVVGYEGIYEVSNFGEVRSLPRMRPYKGSERRVVGKPISAHMSGDSSKYKTVLLCKDGIKSKAKVHLLVLEAFIGPRPEGAVARHSNDISDDNRLENLSWGSMSDNMKDKFSNGYRHHAIRLSDEEIAQVLSMNGSQRELARKFSVSQNVILKIKKGVGYYGKF